MTTREASIKLTMDPGTFQAGMRQLTSKTRAAGDAMGRGLKDPMVAGLKAVRKEAGELVSSLKSGVKQIGTLGGAISMGAGVKAAVDSQRSYTVLAGIISDATGKAVSMADAQGAVAKAAAGAQSSLGAAGSVMKQISGQAGGVGDAADMTERILKQAKRLGDLDPDFVARTFTRLKAKTHASNEEVELMIESMAKLGRETLGLDLDEAIDPADAAEFAGFVNTAMLSMEGATALIKEMGGEVAKDMGQASEFIDEIGIALADSGSLAGMRKALKLSPSDINGTKKPLENMLTILEKKGGKGAEVIMAAFGNPRNQKAIRDMLGGDDVILKAKKGDKAAQQQLVDRAREILAISNTQVDVATEKARIAKRDKALAETSSAKMEDALRKIQQAFESPKMLAAIDKVADKLPALAEGFADLLSWVTDHPEQAAARLVMTKVAAVFGGTVMQEAGVAGMKALWARIMAQQAATAAGGAVAGKAAGVGSALAAGGTAAAATTAAAAAGALAAGLVVGTLIRKGFDTDTKTSDTFGSARSARGVAYQASRAAGSGSQLDRDNAIAKIAMARSDLESKAGFGEDLITGAAAAFTGHDGMGGSSAQRSAAMKQLDAAEARLRAENAKALKEATDLTKQFGTAMKVVTGNAARGPAQSPPAMPGVENP